MTVLLLGDSHTNIFVTPPVYKFDTGACALDLFTAHRFLDASDTDLWSRLTPWFEQRLSNALIVTAGEIDIRAHYWRHIPRRYQSDQDIVSYVNGLCSRYYDKLKSIADHYGIDRVVIWGSPVAGEKALYNSKYPFVGSSATRNMLTHLWNREFYKISDTDKRFSMATAFYDYIKDDYSTDPSTPTDDGVHWRYECGPIFWQNYLVPALNQKGFFSNKRFFDMIDDRMIMVEQDSQGQYLYDTWARTSNLSGMLDTKTVSINGMSYSYVTADQRNNLPRSYLELALRSL